LTGTDANSLCVHNRNAAGSVGRKDLVRMWEIVQVLVSLEGAKEFRGSTGGNRSYLTTHVLSYLDKLGDYQTLSTILAVLCSPATITEREIKTIPITPILTCSLVLSNPSVTPVISQGKPSKLRSSLLMSGCLPPRRIEKETTFLPQIIDCTFQIAIQQYANYLYSLGLYEKRAQLLKLSNQSTMAPSLHISHPCSCNKIPCECKAKCPYCRLSCKTLTAFCLVCKHGGHANCMAKWFQKERFCITGCGCECAKYQ
jgi:hypothetical protein